MKPERNTYFRMAGRGFVLLAILLWISPPVLAQDTDIYKVHVKSNCYILLDTSEAMSFGVYENTINYASMFDYLFTLNETPTGGKDSDQTPIYTHTYINDTIQGNDFYFHTSNQATPNEIYVWLGQIGVTQVSSGGSTVPFTGDAADPGYLWYTNYLIDTYTQIDQYGNLTPSSTSNSAHPSRLTVSGNQILFDGKPLPLPTSLAPLPTLQTNPQILYDGSVVDIGFSGMLNAPGYFFSGYNAIHGNQALPLTTAGDTPVSFTGSTTNENVYFFVTGNWVNMQSMYNLHYVGQPSAAAQALGAINGDDAWVYEYFPWSSNASWPLTIITGKGYPSPSGPPPTGAVPYSNNQDFSETIVSTGNVQMQLHFSSFNVTGDGSASTFTKDYVQIYDSNNNLVAEYDNDNNPTTTNSGWTPVINGSSATIKFHSSSSSTGGTGFNIDQIRSIPSTLGYRMQSRFSVAQDALNSVIPQFSNELNWGLATFGSGAATGATIITQINPNVDQSTAIENKISTLLPPNDTFKSSVANDTTVNNHKAQLMDSLQNVWINGFYKQQSLYSNCAYNFIITVSSGYPYQDNSPTLINQANPSFPTFGSTNNMPGTYNDGNIFAQDPYQYNSNSPPPDYYDSVASWIYNYNWANTAVSTSCIPTASDPCQAAGTLLAKPGSSHENVTTENIAFGSTQPLLQAASLLKPPVGLYMSAYNTQQLKSTFYSLISSISQEVSFTSPVVSVDNANKIQSGNDLYMGLFLPLANDMWTGNLMKFELGDGSTLMSNTDMIYGADYNPAIDSSGNFNPITAPWWGTGTGNTINMENGGAGEVMLAAVQTNANSAATYYNRPIYTWLNGAMVPFVNPNIVPAGNPKIVPADLGLSSSDYSDLYAIINYIHGYNAYALTTPPADVGNPVPLGTPPTMVRPWVMGAVIHSQPVVVDYFDNTSASLPLLHRYVVVGSNDGMLHVFSDPNAGITNPPVWGGGTEVFSFIPPDMLPILKTLPPTINGVTNPFITAPPPYVMPFTVDGPITLYRYPSDTSNVDYNATNAKNPKYLIFGEHRGGSTYWCLNVTNPNPTQWTVAWNVSNSNNPPSTAVPYWNIPYNYTNSEFAQAWSTPQVSTIPITIAANGSKTYQDVVVFSGGYDTTEDNYPEPFTDSITNPTGNPYLNQQKAFTNANMDTTKWPVSNGIYYKYNPGIDKSGRGIFVVDIDNPAAIISVSPSSGPAQQVLPFQVSYSATGTSLNPSSGNPQMRSDMKYCFPASPSLITNTDQNVVNGNLVYEENVLQALYATDIYSNIFKTLYTFNTTNTGTVSNPKYQLNSVGWAVNKVFSANTGSTSLSGSMDQGPDPLTIDGKTDDDGGRKSFFPPAVSLGGTAGYFQVSNFTSSPSLTYNNLGTLATLFFGTGDTEHPTQTIIRNRFYAVYDDSSVTTTPQLTVPKGFLSLTAPYVEDNLLNLTCGELEASTTFVSSYKLSSIANYPTLDPSSLLLPYPYNTTIPYPSSSPIASLTSNQIQADLTMLLTDIYGTNQSAKGWYVILPDQGSDSLNPCSNEISSPPPSTANHFGEQSLSAITLFYNTLYFNSFQFTPTDPCNPQGNGFSYSINYADGTAVYNLNSTTYIDVADRSVEYSNISGIPSAFTIIIRNGLAAAMASMGGSIIGPNTKGFGNDQYEINTPGLGLQLFYWRDSNSMAPLLNP